MALIGRPDLLIADEPTTALDVSVQAQVLRILYDLVRKHRLAVMLITHNLGVVAQLCSHVAVMYAGNIIESGRVDAVLSSPRHPYTRALLAAVPGASAKRGALAALGGSVPNLLNPPPGCRFAPRCAACDAALQRQRPADDRHRAAISGWPASCTMRRRGRPDASRCRQRHEGLSRRAGLSRARWSLPR